MYRVIATSMCVVASGALWANEAIPVPPLVKIFIENECGRAFAIKDPRLEACITDETEGYRATIALLTNPASGDVAAASYHRCSGNQAGGRFHRDKAECLRAATEAR